MKLVNAVALLCLLIFVMADLAHVLPRTETMQARDLVIHLVFDLGALLLLAFSIWCMFLRGPAGALAELKMLVSLMGQLMMLAGVAFFALDPWAAMATSAPEGDKVSGVLTSFAILLVPLGMMAALMRWSSRAELAASQPAPMTRAKRSPRVGDEEDEDQYYEPIPELMGDRYHEPTKVVVKGEASVPRVEVSAALIAAIPMVRQASCAILRVQLGKPVTGAKKAKPKPVKYEAAIVGTATCVVADRYLVTAQQILNTAQPRRPEDRFYALVAPGNGEQVFHFPVVGFPLENPDLDLAVLEIGPCANGVEHLAALSLTLDEVPDGSPVSTLGFPSPPLADLQIDADGEYLGASMSLRGHANTGIVAGQGVNAFGQSRFEFNIAWHHGEGGGPVIRLEPSPALFCVMTDYRPIQGPRGGVMQGPYQGRSLKPIENTLRELGATFI